MIDDFDSQPVFRTPGILNLLKVVFEIKNDSQLAEFLGVTRTAIYTLRMPNRLIGKQIRLVLMEISIQIQPLSQETIGLNSNFIAEEQHSVKLFRQRIQRKM
jgi:hypothetical protein